MAWILGMELTRRSPPLFIATERKSSMATTLIERLNASCNATVGILGDGMSMWEVEGGVEGKSNSGMERESSLLYACVENSDSRV